MAAAKIQLTPEEWKKIESAGRNWVGLATDVIVPEAKPPADFSAGGGKLNVDRRLGPPVRLGLR